MTDKKKQRREDNPDVRITEIMSAALLAAREHGYKLVTREQIADRAMCSPALVGKYFGEMDGLRNSIMASAVVEHDLEVLCQGIITRHGFALAAPEELKALAHQHFLTLCETGPVQLKKDS